MSDRADLFFNQDDRFVHPLAASGGDFEDKHAWPNTLDILKSGYPVEFDRFSQIHLGEPSDVR